MNGDKDFDRIVHDWLEIGPAQLSDRVTEAARLGVHRTKQRRPIGRPGRRTARLMATAAAVVVLVGAGIVGLRLLKDRDAIGGLSPTPSATIAPSASAVVPARLEVRFHVRSSDLFHVPSTESAYPYPDDAAMAVIRDIVLRRLQAAGFADPVVTFADRNTIVVDLPFGVDWKPVRALLEQRGEVAFIPLPADTYGTSSTGYPPDVIDGRPLPADESLKPLFTGAAIAEANPTSDQSGLRGSVQFRLDPGATKVFADYTKDHVGEFFAITLDGTVLAVPSIESAITDGSGVITLAGGAYATTSASDLVAFLRTGALPYKLDWAGNGPIP